MTPETLELLRCPYCGGRLEVMENTPHARVGDALREGLLGCACCVFPVVAGIPVLHLHPNAARAREAIEDRDPGRAFRALVSSDERRGARFAEIAARPDSTYRDLAGALDEELEGGYFLYRFSDPSFVTASAVVRAVAGDVLAKGGRAIDVCGGSGHLARVLQESDPAPVIADLYFAKLWLAARFVAPGCVPVCCDANAPLPFARGAFRLALCADAFMYIWTKRQLVGEMERLVDGVGPAAVVITHAHNQLVWSASHGQPLTPEGYRDLFERLEPRLLAESRLLDDVVAGGPLDLGRRDDPADLLEQEALTIVAGRDEGARALRSHALAGDPPPRGRPALNPLYAVEPTPEGARLTLAFPSEHYEDEYGACRRYLPEETTVARDALDALARGEVTAAVETLLRRRIVLDLPEGYA